MRVVLQLAVFCQGLQRGPGNWWAGLGLALILTTGTTAARMLGCCLVSLWISGVLPSTTTASAFRTTRDYRGALGRSLFGGTQLDSIFSLYLAISGFIIIIISFCLLVDSLYRAVAEAMACSPDERQKEEEWAAKLGPVTGLGLFTVERSTMTSMLTIGLTYLIILLQFKISPG